MSKYKLTFKLKQHTPIIHFQHEQHGATLRASELKPKLDKFIIQKFIEEGKTIPNEWKIGKKNRADGGFALDYKVKVIDCDNRNIDQRTETIIIIPPNSEKAIISNDLLLQIHCFNTDLSDRIESKIDEFFILTSFGKRNSKGFGCFYIKPENNHLDWDYLKSKIPNGTWIKENCLNGNMSQKYNSISKYQRILKSGINHNDYIKSKLFVYNINNHFRWEKRWIKKELLRLISSNILPANLKETKAPNDWCNNLDINTKNDNCSNNNWSDHSEFDNNYRFVRIVLGLPEHWEFMTIDRDIKYKVIPSSNEIERFKSPLTFKIFNSNIFVVLSSLPLDILNKTFKFSVQKKKKINRNGRWIWIDEDNPIDFLNKGNSEKTLQTLNSNEFSIQNFINASMPSLGFTQNNN